jgi:hypothetical protein
VGARARARGVRARSRLARPRARPAEPRALGVRSLPCVRACVARVLQRISQLSVKMGQAKQVLHSFKVEMRELSKDDAFLYDQARRDAHAGPAGAGAGAGAHAQQGQASGSTRACTQSAQAHSARNPCRLSGGTQDLSGQPARAQARSRSDPSAPAVCPRTRRARRGRAQKLKGHMNNLNQLNTDLAWAKSEGERAELMERPGGSQVRARCSAAQDRERRGREGGSARARSSASASARARAGGRERECEGT